MKYTKKKNTVNKERSFDKWLRAAASEFMIAIFAESYFSLMPLVWQIGDHCALTSLKC